MQMDRQKKTHTEHGDTLNTETKHAEEADKPVETRNQSKSRAHNPEKHKNRHHKRSSKR